MPISHTACEAFYACFLLALNCHAHQVYSEHYTVLCSILFEAQLGKMRIDFLKQKKDSEASDQKICKTSSCSYS
jgi:hypothetical protein